MNDDRLDALLAAPLPAVADDGFSTRVMERIARDPYRISWLEIGVLAATALLALFFLPARPVMDMAVQISAQLADSLGAAMACLAIVLTLLFLRISEEE